MSRCNTIVAATLAAAALAAPAALANQDLRSPDTRDAATRLRQDLRSPDTRDAAAGRTSPEVAVIRVPAPSVADDGIDWGSAGAGGVLATLALAAGGVAVVLRRRPTTST